jgi:hypothetical protein
MTFARGTTHTSLLKPLIVALALGGAALPAQADPVVVHVQDNVAETPLPPFPGVTVAYLKLDPGQYMMHVKLRYRGDPVGGESWAGCVFQGVGIFSRDASEGRVQLIGWPGTSDGVMLGFVHKREGDDPAVHVQCFADHNVIVVNPQFVAVPATLVLHP